MPLTQTLPTGWVALVLGVCSTCFFIALLSRHRGALTKKLNTVHDKRLVHKLLGIYAATHIAYRVALLYVGDVKAIRTRMTFAKMQHYPWANHRLFLYYYYYALVSGVVPNLLLFLVGSVV